MYLEFPYSPKYQSLYSQVYALSVVSEWHCVFTCEHVTQVDMSTLHKKTYMSTSFGGFVSMTLIPYHDEGLYMTYSDILLGSYRKKKNDCERQ